MMNTVIDQVSRMDSDELNRVIETVNLRRTYLARATARSLRIGDSVQFTGKTGQIFRGVVTKINQKTVVVDTGSAGKWKVTANMLKSTEVA
jgi:FKBP-type peptidyl-prolyl cis-trans isomerase 2